MRTSSWSVSVVLVAVVTASWMGTARAEDRRPVKQIRWSDEKAAENLAAGEIIPRAGDDRAEQLVVHWPKDGPTSLRILTLNDPGVGPPAYVLRGRVRYDDVKSPGYLELLSYFATGGPYFTRTNAPAGPLQALDGTSDWRDFELPFQVSGPDLPAGQVRRPTKLELNLALPGGGTVYLSRLELAQLSDGVAASGGWWSGQTAGLVGGLGGAAVGCLGGLIGTLASIGRARVVVIRLLVAWILASVVVLIVGIVALALGQASVVYYPLLLLGGLGVLLPAVSLPQVRRQYERRELRRMEALDAG
jgi:hypothetical protein